MAIPPGAYPNLDCLPFLWLIPYFLIAITELGTVLGAVGFAVATAITNAVGIVAVALTVMLTIATGIAASYITSPIFKPTPFFLLDTGFSIVLITLLVLADLDYAYEVGHQVLKAKDLRQTPHRVGPVENLEKYLSKLTVELGLLFIVGITVMACVIAAPLVSFPNPFPAINMGFRSILVGCTMFGAVEVLVARLHGISHQVRGLREIVENLRQWVRPLTVGLAAWGGTRFNGADLTDADFTGASLKGAHLYGATLTGTRFHRARQVNLARLGKTILADVAVQDLLISLRGRGKAYRGKNLQGANLATADLVGADLTEADLSQATLAGADLQQLI